MTEEMMKNGALCIESSYGDIVHLMPLGLR